MVKEDVQRRNSTLRSIGEFLLKKHIAFFDGSKELKVPHHERSATELGIHESTVARAVSNKYIACRKGCSQ